MGNTDFLARNCIVGNDYMGRYSICLGIGMEKLSFVPEESTSTSPISLGWCRCAAARKRAPAALIGFLVLPCGWVRQSLCRVLQSDARGVFRLLPLEFQRVRGEALRTRRTSRTTASAWTAQTRSNEPKFELLHNQTTTTAPKYSSKKCRGKQHPCT